MVNPNDANRGEAQARRLESVAEHLRELLRRPEIEARLRTAPGEDEWNAMEILGHLVEMIPFWLAQSRDLIDATGEPPRFGRTLEDAGRLAGVERGASADPTELLRQLQEETRAAAESIRRLSSAESAKAGIHSRRGEMTVNDIVETFIVAHAEDHLAQLKAALQS
ncbi:MAG: DinB family protein [Chloroflexi bacterium]|nr:DinB family protein [Chloroflexota bacterium]